MSDRFIEFEGESSCEGATGIGAMLMTLILTNTL